MTEDVPAPGLGLEHCAREPIHTPGAIQPHGCLLAFDPCSLVVQQVSANVEAFLGHPPALLLNRPITNSLPRQANASLKRAMSRQENDRCFRLTVKGRQLESLLHEHEGMAILEIEPTGAHPLNDAVLHGPMRQLTTIRSLQALVEATAQRVRELTGFDRVIVYRFNHDCHGEVVSESRAADIESFLDCTTRSPTYRARPARFTYVTGSGAFRTRVTRPYRSCRACGRIPERRLT